MNAPRGERKSSMRKVEAARSFPCWSYAMIATGERARAP
jgi:hypothetical protein